MGSNHSLVGRADPQSRWPVACQGTNGCCRRGTNMGSTCSGPPTVPWSGWVLAGSACDCWPASCCPHSCCPYPCCTHSCSWHPPVRVRPAPSHSTWANKGEVQCDDPNAELEYCIFVASWSNFDVLTPDLVLLNSIMYVHLSSNRECWQGPHKGHWVLCCLWVSYVCDKYTC